jgi:hypothetical protein
LLISPARGEGVGLLRRYFAIGNGDVASAAASALARRGVELKPLDIRVSDSALGAGVAGAEVAVLLEASTGHLLPWLHAVADVTGTVRLQLPSGTYRLAAQTPGHPNPAGAGIPESVAVRLASEAVREATISIELPPAANVEFYLRDHFREPGPGRVTVLGADPSPPSFFTSAGALRAVAASDLDLAITPFRPGPQAGLPRAPSGVTTLAFTDDGGRAVPNADVVAVVYAGEDGVARLTLEPGSYTAIASRGPAYAVHIRSFTAVAGATTRLLFDVPKAVDDYGWMTIDTRVQTSRSRGVVAAAVDQLRAAAGEDLDAVVLADTNVLTPLEKFITAAGTGRILSAVPGIVLSGTPYGELAVGNLEPISLPQQTIPVTAAGESFASGDPDGGAPAAYANGWLSPSAVVAQARERSASGGALTTLPQPRRARTGYFSALDIEFDLARGYDAAHPDAGAIIPRRSAESLAVARPVYDDSWMGLEVFSGDSSGRESWHSFADLMALANLGRRSAALAASASDRLGAPAPGAWRTAVRIGDEPSAQVVGGSAGVLNAAVSGIASGKTVAGNGPLLRLAVSGAVTRASGAAVFTDLVLDPVESGDLLFVDRNVFSDASAVYTLHLTVSVDLQSPEWAPVQRIELFGNAPQPALEPDETGAFLSAVTLAAWDVSALTPTVATLRYVDDESGAIESVSTNARRFQTTLTYETTITDGDLRSADLVDLWFAARVTGTASLYPLVVGRAGAATPVAVASPVFVNLTDNDSELAFPEAYNGPCERPAAARCPRP